MTKIAAKPCDLCHKEVNLRYRVQYDNSNNWVLVCPECWQKVKTNKYYRYGGTWKARKK